MENANSWVHKRAHFRRWITRFGIVLFLAGMSCVSSLSAVFGAADDFETANQLFDQGKFSEAHGKYENLVVSGRWSANLFYDLGNCEYRLGSPGRAILDYERALALDPAHPEATANLALARNQMASKLPAPSWEQSIFVGLSVDHWAIAAAVAGWIAIFGIAALATTKRTETAGLWLTTIAAVAVCAYGGSLLWLSAQEQAVAIVVEKSAEARLAPADTAELADTLPAGSRVRVLSERGEWVYCELPGEGRGWIPQHAIERVRIGKS